MGKLESLDRIKGIWDSNASLEDIVLGISEIYYANGLDLSAVATYIKATPAELDAIIKLSALDDELIKRISDSNPPKTAWTLFANASEDEIKCILDDPDGLNWGEGNNTIMLSDRLVRAAEPTAHDKVGLLPGVVLEAMCKKGVAYNALDKWPRDFLRDIANKRKIGKILSDRQIEKTTEILRGLVNDNVITRDCIDSDAEYCNIVLDALEE